MSALEPRPLARCLLA